MSVSVLQTSSASLIKESAVAPLHFGTIAASFGDWRDALLRDGVVVVPGVLSQERAASYESKAQDWLESFGLGYDRKDPATYRQSNLPQNEKGGLYTTHGACHQQFLWDLRQEEKVIDAFEKIWRTRELLVSFDGVNIGVPMDLTQKENKGLDTPWPHVDQSPRRSHLQCIQGIVNLAENGPLDGGLMVFHGSRELFVECFHTFSHQAPTEGWSDEDWYRHTPEMIEWMKEKGCHWEKICAHPGDLILWDSRATHYGSIPLSTNARLAAYVCYKPASLATDETYKSKQDAFKRLAGSTHDPVKFGTRSMEPATTDKAWEAIKDNLPAPPILSSVGRKLAGLERY